MTIRSEGFAMAVLAAVCRLRAAGVPIIVSYCDNLAPLSCPRGALYRDLLKLADEIIVPCRLWLPWLLNGLHPICLSTL